MYPTVRERGMGWKALLQPLDLRFGTCGLQMCLPVKGWAGRLNNQN